MFFAKMGAYTRLRMCKGDNKVQKFGKKVISSLCAAILLLSVSGVVATAAGPEHPKFPDGVTYCRPVNVKSTEQNKGEFVIHTDILPMGQSVTGGNTKNYPSVDFYITFPTTGGFHLRTLKDDKASGFFDVQNIENIHYTTTDGKVRMKGADGTVLSYQKTSGGFVLEILSSTGAVVQIIRSEDIQLGYQANGGIIASRITMPLRDDEAIYNGCERFNAVNQVGYKFSLWNLDACYHSVTTPSYTHTNSYNNVPLFHSTSGYSVWYDMTYAATADVGSTEKTVFSVEFQGKNLDLYMWSGSILENIKKYTAITGTSITVPKWAFGYWLGATSGAWSNGVSLSENYNADQVQHYETAYENLEKLFEGYKAMGITDIAAVYGEGANFKFNEKAYGFLKKQGSRMLIWYTPQSYKWHMGWYLPSYTVNDLPYALLANDPKPGNYSFDTGNGLHFWDFTHPKAFTAGVGFLTNGHDTHTRLRPYVAWGAQGSLLDFGEYLQYDALCYNGRYGDEMHNRISYDYAKVMTSVWNSMDIQGQKDGYVLFQRSGTAGTQAYVGQFLGDQNRSFDGLMDQLHALISMGSGGFNIYSGDINGHMGNNGSEELYIRWLQFGTFNPLMRTQGNLLPSPWDWNNDGKEDKNAKAIFPTYYWLRMNLQDALYSASIDANKNATPMVMALGVAYQDQKGVRSVDDQYIFLNNLLVAPVTESGLNGTVNRYIVLPEGNWYDVFNGDRVAGGRTVTRTTTLQEMPLYLKSGATLAVELPKTMKLMESMGDADTTARYKALVITPPDKTTTNTVYASASDVTKYTSLYEDAYHFTVSADKKSNRKMIVAYGVDAKSIQVDGVALKKMNTVPDVTKGETGYYTDGKYTYIVLGSNWNKLSVQNAVSTVTPTTSTSDTSTTRTKRPQSTNGDAHSTANGDTDSTANSDIQTSVTGTDGSTVSDNTGTTVSDQDEPTDGATALKDRDKQMNGDTSTNNTVWIIAAIAGAVLLLCTATVCLLLLLKKRRNKSQQASEQSK